MEDAKSAALPIEVHVTGKNNAHPIDDALSDLLATLNSIRLTYNGVMPRTAKWLGSEYDKHRKILAKFTPPNGGDGTRFLTQSTHDAIDALSSVRAMSDLMGTQILRTLQRSLFTQIFCEFDTFIGALLVAIYTRKAELFKGISREISLTELLEFESLDAVKQNMLAKEIETFRRDSYIEQFAALERKFGFKTLRQFREWGDFVELSQRRNILIHNGGRVSEQYLSVCDRENYAFETRPSIGDVLEPDGKYIGHAIRVISHVAFMLTHTLWRKVLPDENERADEAANNTIYRLLEQERWRTAMAVSEFALSEPMRRSLKEIDLRIRIINCAIAMKFSGKDADAKKVLESMDWSASYRDFRLAKAVLTDDFDEACSLMRSIGRSGEIIDQFSYHRFPLFHKFRESREFQEAYQNIYGESFVRRAMAEVKGASDKMASKFDEVEEAKVTKVGGNGEAKQRPGRGTGRMQSTGGKTSQEARKGPKAKGKSSQSK